MKLSELKQVTEIVYEMEVCEAGLDIAEWNRQARKLLHYLKPLKLSELDVSPHFYDLLVGRLGTARDSGGMVPLPRGLKFASVPVTRSDRVELVHAE